MGYSDKIFKAALVGLLLIGLVVIPGSRPVSGQEVRASVRDDSLVLAAVRVLEEDYVDPVQPVPLLNAAIATLRKATGLGPDALLPDIAPGPSESEAA